MKHTLQTAAIGALGGMLVLALMAQVPMAIRSDGIQFTDGTILTSADTRRSFYLTEDPVVSTAALGACAPGFHMASLWEILEVSTLRYANDHPDAFDWMDDGLTSDAGEGPPTDRSGWVRTGLSSNGVAAEGVGNCNAWTSSSSEDSGTVVQLRGSWDDSDPSFDLTWPWKPADWPCNSNIFRLWCVAD